MKQFNKYILFWLTQSISQLGSAMTSFALILWTYEQKHSAMAVSLMSFCSYIPLPALLLTGITKKPSCCWLTVLPPYALWAYYSCLLAGTCRCGISMWLI